MQQPSQRPRAQSSGPLDEEREPGAEFDAGNREHVKERDKRVKDRERRRINGLRQVLEQPDSRLWLWDLLEKCGISRLSFTGNSQTFFNEGARNVGLNIQADLTREFPERYVEMLKEAGAREDQQRRA